MHNKLKQVGLVAASLSVLSLTVATPTFAASDQHRNEERAVASYQAMQKHFFQSSEKLYIENYPHNGGNSYSYLWPLSQATAATLDLAALSKGDNTYISDVSDRLQGIADYWNNTTTPPGYDSYVRPPLGQGGDKFYDDNDWIAQDLLKAYRLTGDNADLQRVKQIFQLEVNGWDSNLTHPDPGGVFWTQASWNHDRNTISNAPTAMVGLDLYQLTGDRYYFDWAKKMYDWVNQYMLAPNGLYWDHVDLQGNVNKTQWSYNQGTMIGASLLFFKATGDPSYLQRAEDIAKKALAFYGQARLYNQPDFFNAIFFENLLTLEKVDHNPAYRQAIQTYADEMWNTVRDPNTGLFQMDPSQETPLLQQAAMVEIYADLASVLPHQSDKNVQK